MIKKAFRPAFPAQKMHLKGFYPKSPQKNVLGTFSVNARKTVAGPFSYPLLRLSVIYTK
jgi:hypothetical protein